MCWLWFISCVLCFSFVSVFVSVVLLVATYISSINGWTSMDHIFLEISCRYGVARAQEWQDVCHSKLVKILQKMVVRWGMAVSFLHQCSWPMPLRLRDSGIAHIIELLFLHKKMAYRNLESNDSKIFPYKVKTSHVCNFQKSQQLVWMIFQWMITKNTTNQMTISGRSIAMQMGPKKV